MPTQCRWWRVLFFWGILVVFAVSPEQTLSRSLTRAMHAFWGHDGILKACRTAVADRLMLLTAFVASRWRWMSPAVRPTTRFLRLLETCHTNLLMMICNPARDPLCGVHSDWISRRRAARMRTVFRSSTLACGPRSAVCWILGARREGHQHLVSHL